MSERTHTDGEQMDDYEVIFDFDTIERRIDGIEYTEVAFGTISEVETDRNVRYRFRINHDTNELEEDMYYYLGDEQIAQGPKLSWDYDITDDIVLHGSGHDTQQFIFDALHNDPEAVLEYEFESNTSWEPEQ